MPILIEEMEAEVVPEGFEIELETEPGNVIEIGSLRITRSLHEGCCRKEIEIPDGKIWRATAGKRPMIFGTVTSQA